MDQRKFPRKITGILVLIAIILISCQTRIDEHVSVEHSPSLSMDATLSRTPTPEPTITHTSTLTQTSTSLPTETPTSTITSTPTITATPTITLTPTYAFPVVTINVAAAHCRYGPSKAYLHAADLYEGDQGVVHGRFLYSDWLYIKWEKLHYHCWVSPYVVDVSGDISIILYQNVELWRIPSTLYEAPKNVRAYRQGDTVTITWDSVWMTEDDDRGYLIEAWVCQNGAYMWWTASFEDQFTTSYSVQDDDSCQSPSSGVIYTVEKHGYTQPVTIPWPGH
jgi:hypothetical protein